MPVSIADLERALVITGVRWQRARGSASALVAHHQVDSTPDAPITLLASLDGGGRYLSLRTLELSYVSRGEHEERALLTFLLMLGSRFPLCRVGVDRETDEVIVECPVVVEDTDWVSPAALAVYTASLVTLAIMVKQGSSRVRRGEHPKAVLSNLELQFRRASEALVRQGKSGGCSGCTVVGVLALCLVVLIYIIVR